MNVSRQHGFSLMELVAVMALLAIAIAVVSFGFSKSLTSAKIEAASRDLAAMLKYTRGQAIAKGEQQIFEINVETNSYKAPGRPMVRLPASMHLGLLTASNELTSAQSGSIRFYPDGSSTGGHVMVYLGKREWRINVSWLTGEVGREELQR